MRYRIPHYLNEFRCIETRCETPCKEEPRRRKEFEGLREGALSLSCIEAAKLILGCKEPIRFFEFEDDEEWEPIEQYDSLLADTLMLAREEMIKLLQSREIDIYIRMSRTLSLVQKMQESWERSDLSQIASMLETFGNMDDMLEYQKKAEQWIPGENEYCSTMRKLFRRFYTLETVKEDWPEFVKRAEFTLYVEGQRAYEEKRQRFHKSIGLKSDSYDTWSCLLEQLMVYEVYGTFCDAVYDGHIVEKIQAAVVKTLLVQELCIARWAEQEEHLDFNEVINIACRMAKELELSEMNPARFYKLCEKLPAFGASQLKGLLTFL